MTDEETELIKRYGITVEQKNVYTYQGHTYERLQDALNYAELSTARNAGAGPDQPAP